MLAIDGILILSIILLLLLLSALWPPDSPWAPWWQTPSEVVRLMCQLMKVKKGTKIYDLGCGTGYALILAAKEFEADGVGIEIDPLRYWNAKFNVKRFGVSDKVKILRENFFNVSLKDADALFIYLVPKALEKLAPKFLQELKKGTMIASYRYKIPIELFNKRLKLIEEDKNSELFVYKIV